MAIEPDVPTVARVVIQRIIAGLEFLGIDPVPVLARCGLAADAATTLPERVPHALIGELFVAARELTGDRGLGVRLAELVEPEFYDLFGYVVKASATLAEALARTERYPLSTRRSGAGPATRRGRSDAARGSAGRRRPRDVGR